VTLRLRPAEGSVAPAPRLRWAENTVDNEFMGRKSSKKCCIFHKRRKFGEDSSSEEDSSGSDDDRGGNGGGGAGGDAGGGSSGGCGDGDGTSSSEKIISMSSGNDGGDTVKDGKTEIGLTKGEIRRAGRRKKEGSSDSIQNCPHCVYLQRLKEQRIVEG